MGVTALAACSSGTGGTGPTPTPTAASTFVVEGSVAVESDFVANMQADNTTLDGPCAVKAGYDDIKGGAQVVVLDAAGSTVGLGTLATVTLDLPDGTTSLASAFCRATFRVVDVPAGSDFYAIQIASRDPYRLTAADARKPVELSLGDL
ncbi:MAG: hypothetical protein NVV66_18290 [Cellulomonas sp.]|uniref:hypothetical protein n=1 Tax=Cellulomonas sp. TaxID=40001 RepID=UPI00258F1970|nr:hypothetical protein [Cellulomonas sp.]MCR6706547.1 hypothetical protein [Cellulomonas sp.]